MNLSKLSIKELESLKEKWYDENKETISTICTICRVKGERLDHNYGPKYSLIVDNINIYVDDYGHFALVKVHEKTVMSTHPNEQLFIPGKWVNSVLALLPDVEEIQRKRHEENIEKERKNLIDKLTVPEEE